MDFKAERRTAFRATVRFRLGPGAGAELEWNRRTTLPTLASDGPIRRLAARLQVDVSGWLYDESRSVALEECEGRWRPAIRALSAGPGDVPSVAESVAAFNSHIRPMERAVRTRGKYKTHRLSVLTWAVWKGILPELMPMSDDLVRAFVWDALAFETSLPVLKHCLGAIKAWHQRLQLRVPLDAAGDFRRFTHSLGRFQGAQRRIIFPIHARAVRSLLRLRLPAHPSCAGVAGGCPICRAFLHSWSDCLAGALTTVVCGRCAETAGLQVCDRWENYDGLAGYRRFEGGSLINIKVRKNDQIREGHRPRIGVSADPGLDINDQLTAFFREAGLNPRKGCTKRSEPHAPCPVCPPMFPRSIRRGTAFDLGRLPTSSEVSAMIVRGLEHVGYDTSLFSGISARRGGLSTAIEKGVPEHILWMQSGHAQDAAARRYVRLGSPALLYDTWAAFGL